MSKSWRKILIIGASLLMMASVGTGVGNTKVNASHYHFNNRYSNPFSRMLERKGWTSGPLSAFKHFNYNGHSFTLRTSSRAFQGEITSLDGNHHATNRQIVTALNGGNPYYHHYRKHYRRSIRRHYRKHARKHYRRSVKKAKKHATKKRTRKPRKATKKVFSKVGRFRKTAKYHNLWTNAKKMNQKAVNYDLKQAAKYSRSGNMKAAKKTNQKANYMKGFVKHDQMMLNLGK